MMNLRGILFILLFMGLVGTSSFADEEAGTVILRRKVLFSLKSPDPRGLSATERALITSERLGKVFLNPFIGPEQIFSKQNGDHFVVMASSVIVLRVWAGDAAQENMTIEDLAKMQAETIRKELADGKPGYFTLRLLTRYFLGLLYPLLLISVLMALRRIRRAGSAWILRLKEDRPSFLRLGTFEIVSMRGFKLLLHAIFTLISWSLILVVCYGFLLAVFYYFPGTRNLATRLMSIAYDAFAKIGEIAFGHLIRLLVVGGVLAATYALIQTIDKWFDEVAHGNKSLHPYITLENADTIEFLAKGAVVFAAVFLIVLLLPSEGGRIGIGVLVLIGLSLSLAAVPILQNVIIGFMLAFMPHHRRGSHLLLNGHEVTVLRRGIMYTFLQTSDRTRWLVPNREIANATVLFGQAQDHMSWRGEAKILNGVSLKEFHSSIEEWAKERGDKGFVRILETREEVVVFTLHLPQSSFSPTGMLVDVHDSLRQWLDHIGIRLLSVTPKD